MSIESRVGQGTTLRVKIPLTLAIIPALIVEAGGQRYAIPQVSVREIVTLHERPAGGHGSDRQCARLSPARRTAAAGGSARGAALVEPAVARGGQSANIVGAAGGRTTFRPDGGPWSATRRRSSSNRCTKLLQPTVACFPGATIMGDGRVALILDVVGLAGVRRGRGSRSMKRQVAGAKSSPEEERRNCEHEGQTSTWSVRVA